MKNRLLFILIFVFAVACSQERVEESNKQENKSEEVIPKTEIQKLKAGKIPWPPYQYIKDMLQSNGLANEKINKGWGEMSRYSVSAGKGFIIKSYQIKKIDYLLKDDVIRFYSLENKSNSSLKRKILLESKEFKLKEDSLEILREQFKSKTFYLDWVLENSRIPRSSDRFVSYYNQLRYDLNSKSFTVSTTALTKKFINKPYLIYRSYRTLLFKLPDGLSKSSTSFESLFKEELKSSSKNILYRNGIPDTLRNKLREKYRPEGVKQDLHLKVSGENTALKIENNSKKIRLQFIFNVTDIINNDADFLSTTRFKDPAPDYLISTKLQKIVVYNDSTGIIYKEYQ